MIEPVTCLAVIVTYKSIDSVDTVFNVVGTWLRADSRRAAVMIDNSGSVESVIRARRAVPESVGNRFIAEVSPENVGFSHGVNKAYGIGVAKWGKPNTVLLQNPDVITTVEVLEGVTNLVDRPGIGVAAPVLRSSGGVVDRGSARRAWNRRRLFAELVGAPSLSRVLLSQDRSVPVDGDDLYEVDFASGAYLAIRSEIFGDGLDTRLPMYLEDQEVCWRARTLGFRVVVAGWLRAVHIGAVSRKSNSSQKRDLRLMELVIAPCLSLKDTAGVSDVSLRTVVLLAGILRALSAFPVSLTRGRDERRGWLLDQLILSRWFITWSLSKQEIGSVRWAG